MKEAAALGGKKQRTRAPHARAAAKKSQAREEKLRKPLRLKKRGVSDNIYYIKYVFFRYCCASLLSLIALW